MKQRNNKQVSIHIKDPVSDSTHKTENGTGSMWFAIVAIILVSVTLRPGIISSGPLLPFIQSEFNLSHTMASLLITIPDFLMGILALSTPWLAHRFGRNQVILAALILLSFSMVARALSPNTFFLLSTTVGVGASIAIAGTLMGGFIKGNFPTKAAVLMGIYSAALSLGTSVSAGVSGAIASNTDGGWRLATGIWAIPGIFAVIAWLIVTIRAKKFDRSSTVKAAMQQPKLPVGNRTAWMIAVFFGLMNFLFYALASWTAPMYQEQGRTAASAGLIFLTFTVVFMIANPVFGSLSKSSDRRAWLAISAVLAVIGLTPIAIWPDFAPFVCMSVAAFGLGGAFTLSMTLPLDNTNTVEESNAWNAFVMTVGYLIAATGPILVGFIRDLSGDFSGSLWVLVGVASLLLVLTPFLKPENHLQS